MMPIATFGEPPVLYGPSLEYVAMPERIVEGVVREAGSGKLLPGVHVSGGTGYGSQVGAITDKEGRYRLRVTHPSFLPEVRMVEVHAGQRSDLKIAMGRPPVPRVIRAAAVAEEPGPISKFFKDLFQ